MDGLADGIALVFSCLGLPAFERDMGEYTLVIRDKTFAGLPEKWVWAKIEKNQIHMEVKLSLGIRGASWLNKVCSSPPPLSCFLTRCRAVSRTLWRGCWRVRRDGTVGPGLRTPAYTTIG